MRYGQTLFNQQKKVQGWCDSPLTQEGIQRFMSCLETIAKSHADNVLVVAHGGVIMSALRCLDEAQFMKHMQVVRMMRIVR